MLTQQVKGRRVHLKESEWDVVLGEAEICSEQLADPSPLFVDAPAMSGMWTSSPAASSSSVSTANSLKRSPPQASSSSPSAPSVHILPSGLRPMQ